MPELEPLPEDWTRALAVVAHPDDLDGLREQLTRLLTDEVWRAEAVPLGLARARLMTWERCLAQTVDVYRELA